MLLLRRFCGDIPVCLRIKEPKCDWFVNPNLMDISLMLSSWFLNKSSAVLTISSLMMELAVLPEICLQMELKYVGEMLSFSA